MKAVSWPLCPVGFKRKKGKLGEKDGVPGSLAARLGRGSARNKGTGSFKLGCIVELC